MSCVMMPSRGSASRSASMYSRYGSSCDGADAARFAAEFLAGPACGGATLGTHGVEQHLHREPGIAMHLHLGGVVAAQLRRIDVDVDEPLRHRQPPIARALRAHLAADDDADLAAGEHVVDDVVRTIEGDAERERMIARNRALAGRGRDDRRVERLGEFGEHAIDAALHRAATGIDHHTVRRPDRRRRPRRSRPATGGGGYPPGTPSPRRPLPPRARQSAPEHASGGAARCASAAAPH